MAAQHGTDDPPRIEMTLDTGFEYRPGEPVRIRVVRRGPRTWVGDDAGAVECAGRPPGWRETARGLERELDVNVGRNGSIFLPVVRVGPSEKRVVQRIGEASVSFYQDLLDLA